MADMMQGKMEAAEDRTLYWTLSFYIPVDNVFPGNATGRLNERVRFRWETDIPPELGQAEVTQTLRHAIEPLFNDIADRSRVGRVGDQLFAAAGAEELLFDLPPVVEWMTEGRRYRVAIPPHHRERAVGLRRFWYLHDNGSLSWHLSFRARYGADLDRDIADGVPSTYYFLSLLQKLAWPKEFLCAVDGAGVDDIVGIGVRPAPDGARLPFWAFVEHCLRHDKTLIDAVHGPRGGVSTIDALCPPRPSLEVPNLRYRDNRSLFFIHDSAFFRLIQPKDDSGALESRRLHVTDGQFLAYPGLITQHSEAQDGALLLGEDYWRAVLGRDAGADDPARDDVTPGVDHERRLAYLFLAGFNQNIIDFTNQEASEVLDSLDPIYPASDEQMEEGFFIRYANPRAMITYVPRSRTLEVGNDHIGTCPYAFLIHVLSMHNEALTRAQEADTFGKIDTISIDVAKAANLLTSASAQAGELLAARNAISAAEQTITDVRLGAFEVYDRYRYANPFRYDTEREVFDALERLRGTSRLEKAYQSALSSMEDHARDLDRLRKDLEADRDAVHQRNDKRRDFSLTLLFGSLGALGLIQMLFQLDQYANDHIYGAKNAAVAGHNLAVVATFVVVPVLIFVGLMAALVYRSRR